MRISLLIFIFPPYYVIIMLSITIELLKTLQFKSIILLKVHELFLDNKTILV